MNVEIGAEAALFPEKEYISGIFVAVYLALFLSSSLLVLNTEQPSFSLSYHRWYLHLPYPNTPKIVKFLVTLNIEFHLLLIMFNAQTKTQNSG
jgi:hypothetical protein